jgi:hypothetical protein
MRSLVPNTGLVAISNRSTVAQLWVACARWLPVTRTRMVWLPEVSRGLVHTATSPV